MSNEKQSEQIRFEPEIDSVEHLEGKAIVHFKQIEVSDEKTIEYLKKNYPQKEFTGSFESGNPDEIFSRHQ